MASAGGAAPWLRPAGEGALLLRFGTEIDAGVNAAVLRALARLDASARLGLGRRVVANCTTVQPLYTIYSLKRYI
jgi:hypothetical protein